MDYKQSIESEIRRRLIKIYENQEENGAFRYPFESGPMTDAYLLILLRVLEEADEKLILGLVKRLLTTQMENGAWKLYEDSEGHLSSTIEAYTALLFSGFIEKEDENMKKAERFILSQGGLKKAHTSTKFMLALNGLYPWPALFPFPLLILGLPHWFPLSFFSFSAYVRAHFAPALILGFYRYSIKNKCTPDLSHLFIKKPKPSKIKFLKVFRDLSHLLSKKSLNKAKSMTLSLQGEDGTVQKYASATFYFIYALLALGYNKNAPPIKKAISGLHGLLTHTERGIHLQNSPSTVWDTALITYAIHTSTNNQKGSIEGRAIDFLLKIKRNHKGTGGWPFSESESSIADLDDTQAVLRALFPYIGDSKEIRECLQRGVAWLLDNQNRDGGFSAFEKNKSSTLFARLPFQNFKDTLIDPSTADLTGRILEFLGTYLGMTEGEISVKKAVNWLKQHQEENGSWYGRWGVSFIYGTWAALTGLSSVGIPRTDPVIIKAKEWLENIQNADGGWGESCLSDEKRTFILLPYSTLTQTAWAVDALIAVSSSPTPIIDQGINFLLTHKEAQEKEKHYPNGSGLPGHFYIYYHSYPEIWPLLALSHYKGKYFTS